MRKDPPHVSDHFKVRPFSKLYDSYTKYVCNMCGFSVYT